ncbi:MAG: hypothetical protein ACPGXK_16800, partial [Phycisphaerae bacterium]
YAFVQDSFALCREGLDRLKAVLDACEIVPERILSLPDRGSQILSHAAGTVLALPVEPWAADKQGLVVAYDIQDNEPDVMRSLYQKSEGQLLFSHATCWTDSFPYTADITTMLAQVQRAPWGEGMRMVDGELETFEASDEPVEELAQQIVDAELDDDDLSDVDVVVRLAKAAGEFASFRRIAGPRERAWMGPVASNRFL